MSSIAETAKHRTEDLMFDSRGREMLRAVSPDFQDFAQSTVALQVYSQELRSWADQNGITTPGHKYDHLSGARFFPGVFVDSGIDVDGGVAFFTLGVHRGTIDPLGNPGIFAAIKDGKFGLLPSVSVVQTFKTNKDVMQKKSIRPSEMWFKLECPLYQKTPIVRTSGYVDEEMDDGAYARFEETGETNGEIIFERSFLHGQQHNRESWVDLEQLSQGILFGISRRLTGSDALAERSAQRVPWPDQSSLYSYRQIMATTHRVNQLAADLLTR